MPGVEGRRALVTGAGSIAGIGFATARILAAQGARVAITSTTKRIFDRLAEMPDAGKSGNHVAFVADLTRPKAADRLVAEATKALGRIDILVNNAGMVQIGHPQKASLLHLIDDAEWTRAIELNLNTNFRVTRAVLPQMMRRRYGRIVHISSVTGPLVSNPHSAGYSAGKAAITGMMRAPGTRSGGQGNHGERRWARLDQDGIVGQARDRRRRPYAGRPPRHAPTRSAMSRHFSPRRRRAT